MPDTKIYKVKFSLNAYVEDKNINLGRIRCKGFKKVTINDRPMFKLLKPYVDYTIYAKTPEIALKEAEAIFFLNDGKKVIWTECNLDYISSTDGCWLKDEIFCEIA